MLHPTHKKISFFLRRIFVMFLVSGLLVWSPSCKKQEKFTGPREKVTIGIGSMILSLPILVASEKGFFSDEGLDVTVKYYPSGKKAMEGMFAGEVEFSTVADTPIVFNSFIREDFVVIATFVYSYDDVKVICRKDRGVNRPADLRGKKIGTSLNTSAHFFSHIYLIEHGIDKSDVKIIDIPPEDLPGALQDGKVDAIVIFEPYAYRAQKALTDKAARLPKTRLYRLTFNLTAMKRFANEHPEMLKKILKAVDRAIEFIKQNKKESIGVTVQKTNLEEEFLVSVWDDFVYELSLDHSLLATLEDEARWAIKNKLTDRTEVPNYLGFIYMDGLKAVKPGAATIIK